MTHLFMVFSVVVVLAGVAGPAAHAQEERPLLIDGTSTLYQRVLTRPGTPRVDSPDGVIQDRYPAFQPLYVFARDGPWLKVGGAAGLPAEGWVNEDATIGWRHNVVAVFTNTAGRERQLLFSDLESLDSLIHSEAAVSLARELRRSVDEGGSGGDSGVISIEPAEYVDINNADTFYILPILEFHEDFHPMSADLFLKMRVASVPLQGESGAGTSLSEDSIRDSDAGVMIVLDTTRSMEPFIAETLEVMEEEIRRIAGTQTGERVHFGILGFRDNPDAAEGIDYRVRVFAPLERGAAIDAPLAALSSMEVARVSTPGYNEDSLAAIRHALEETDWAPDGEEFVKKLVILVTDAGPKHARDSNAETGINAAALRAMAREQNVGIIVIHLLTPDGLANHEYAASQYRDLAAALGHVFYYPVTGGRQDFGDEIRATITRVMSQVSTNLEGELTRVPEPDETGDVPEGAELDVLGLAMELAYLGRVLETRAPDVFEAWMADRALEDPRKLAVEPRLLITKNQLSSLRDVLAAVLEVGESTQAGGAANDFFSQLQGAVSRMAQDPDRLINTGFDTLGSAFGEFLEGLPYQSRVMEITQERWDNMGTGRRQIIDDLRSRFLLYERWHDDPSLWVALYDDAPDGEHVYAMPFDALP